MYLFRYGKNFFSKCVEEDMEVMKKEETREKVYLRWKLGERNFRKCNKGRFYAEYQSEFLFLDISGMRVVIFHPHKFLLYLHMT